MKLLIITQKVDLHDSMLGFFHGWIKSLAKHFGSITVLCLYKGTADLPENISVHSLGKESGGSRISYIKRFYSFVWTHRSEYDAVFVHMNQVYILLAGLLWKILKKKIFLWRNHRAGSHFTDLAACMCNKIFCTSRYSYTAKYSKTVFMPVGVDTSIFKETKNGERVPYSILFLGRIAPIKKPHVFLDALGLLGKRGVRFIASIYGDHLPAHVKYYDGLKRSAAALVDDGHVTFHPGVPHGRTVAVYNTHGIYVNLSSSGSYDKTIFEAMACGCLPLVTNRNLRGKISEDLFLADDRAETLAKKLEHLLSLLPEDQKNSKSWLSPLVAEHSLEHLSKRLTDEISQRLPISSTVSLIE